MLSVVEARTSRGALLTLPLEDISNGFAVTDIEGLDPVKATLVSSSSAGVDGEIYQTAKREARDIKLKLELIPDYISTSVRDLRDTLYQFFMTKSWVGLRFYDSDGLTVDISGRVEDFSCPLFVEEPEANISIRCFDPDFLGLDTIVVNGTTTSSTIDSTGRLTVDYEGTVETGVVFNLYVDRDLNEFTIYHRTSDTEVANTFNFAAPLVTGDVLKISTISGAKGVTLTRSGTQSSLLWGKDPRSPWIELEQGENFIRFYAEGAAIPFDMQYVNRYGGL